MAVRTVVTEDGSVTLYLPELHEHYHSKHGAMQESVYVFIEKGLKEIKVDGEIRIFEMGLGTGLNAWLTAREAVKGDRKIVYHSIELFPIPDEAIASLNYAQTEEEIKLLTDIHQCDWDVEVEIHPLFVIKKIKADIRNYPLPFENYHMVYYDAFGPRAQSFMWEEPVLSKVTGSMKDKGIFVTYCAQGAMKRILKSLGLEVERLQGPPGKREMTRGIKKGS